MDVRLGSMMLNSAAPVQELDMLKLQFPAPVQETVGWMNVTLSPTLCRLIHRKKLMFGPNVVVKKKPVEPGAMLNAAPVPALRPPPGVQVATPDVGGISHVPRLTMELRIEIAPPADVVTLMTGLTEHPLPAQVRVPVRVLP
jgi:hypothetical protein